MVGVGALLLALNAVWRRVRAMSWVGSLGQLAKCDDCSVVLRAVGRTSVCEVTGPGSLSVKRRKTRQL